MSNILLSSPSLSGTMTESSLYRVMNVGLTDTILLLGHADATVMYEPYQVINPKDAITFLNADGSSPLLRSFLELYNANCKDIWLMAVAPMSEYESTIADRNTPNASWDNQSFYERYFDRLATAYASLSGYDFPEIIVPVEAVFYDSQDVDFLTQLVDFCSSSFATTGKVSLGILGTRIVNFSSSSIEEMINDSRLATYGSNGKFVMIVVGEGVSSQMQLALSYSTNLATSTAALMATVPLNRSIIGIPFYGISALAGIDLTQAQIESLAQAKLNVATRTTRGKRGYAYQTRLVTDNTLGEDNSDFWSMAQMHMVASIINNVRSFGFSYIGTTYVSKFKEAVYNYLVSLTSNGYIKTFTINMTEEDLGQRILVYISFVPIFGIRQITFQVEVGPGR